MRDHTTSAVPLTQTRHFPQDDVAAARTVADTQQVHQRYCWLPVMLHSAKHNNHSRHTVGLHFMTCFSETYILCKYFLIQLIN